MATLLLVLIARWFLSVTRTYAQPKRSLHRNQLIETAWREARVKILHPSGEVERNYHSTSTGNVTPNDLAPKTCMGLQTGTLWEKMRITATAAREAAYGC